MTQLNDSSSEQSADLTARRLLVASYLYYNHAISQMPDEAYDHWSAWLAKPEQWDILTALRQWTLGGSAAGFRSSGAGCKFTRLCVASAHSTQGYKLPIVPADQWKFNEEFRVSYIPVTG